MTDDIGRRRSFNTAVAAVMELLNAIGKFDSTTLAGRVVAHEALEIAVMCLSPMIPHVTHELWRELGHEHGAGAWSAGGRRIRMRWCRTRSRSRCRSMARCARASRSRRMRRRKWRWPPALADANVQKFVDGKPIRKAIYVKGKLVNIVV